MGLKVVAQQWNMRYRKAASMVMVILLMLMATGCLYSGENKKQNLVSYRESVNRIQLAVDDYQKEEGLLPIINADQDTPRYEKFRVDMNKLKNKGYIDEIPATSFEMGGSAYFLILDEETNPTIKVMDLVTVQKVNEVQQAVDKYKRNHANDLPLGELLYPNVHTVDLVKIGVPKIELTSVYSGQDMKFIMDGEGIVYADYAFDIMQAIDNSDTKPTANKDLRVYLEESSQLVPVKSLPYVWENGEPVASFE
ncbi:hypothetical protein J2T13_004549 [Paenibacillus sp. DS2015]|uniref:DUF3939 domain-containing protein n=1 Tax=Paenibacillus sp. DS2015 TaxID=3373917 RepID=UPI003D244285